MGFLSKLWKGVKKTFKKIGKGIKSAFMKVGKFMNKIGIVGQIALGLILPGIGSALGAWAGTTLAAGSTAGVIAKGAATFVNAAINVGTKVGSVFKTVTQGVTKVVGDTVGAVLNKVPKLGDTLKTLTGGRLDITQKTFKGAFKTAGNVLTDTVAAGKDLFSMDTLTGDNRFYLESLEKNIASGNVKDSSVSSGKIGALPDPEFTEQIKDVGNDFKIVDGKMISTTPSTTTTSPSLLSGGSTNVPTATENIGPLKEGYEFLKEKGQEQVEKFGDKVTSGLAARVTGTGPQAAEITSYSSSPASSEPIVIGQDSTIMGTQAYQAAMQGNNVLGFFGNPSLIYNAEQETANFVRQQQAGGI